MMLPMDWMGWSDMRAEKVQTSSVSSAGLCSGGIDARRCCPRIKENEKLRGYMSRVSKTHSRDENAAAAGDTDPKRPIRRRSVVFETRDKVGQAGHAADESVYLTS
jgi:hypothetical protein